jgi:hypothetical protein
MDIRRAVSEFVFKSTELLSRIRSYEGEMLTEVDLHVLRVQLHLLDYEAANRQYMNTHSHQEPSETP